MSRQEKIDIETAVKLPLIPSDIYYAHEAPKVEAPALAAQTALDEMYAYFGSDQA